MKKILAVGICQDAPSNVAVDPSSIRTGRNPTNTTHKSVREATTRIQNPAYRTVRMGALELAFAWLGWAAGRGTEVVKVVRKDSPQL